MDTGALPALRHDERPHALSVTREALMRALTRILAPFPDDYEEYFEASGLEVQLDGPRVRLRYVRLADTPRLCELFRDPEVTRHFTWEPPSNLEETEEYLRGFQHEIYSHAGAIGVCNLYHINRSHAEAEVGIWLGRPYWGQGYQSEVNALLIGHAREQLGFRRLLFRVAVGNLRARRAFEGLGASPRKRVFLYSHRLHRDVEHIVYALGLTASS
jgi:RimJ/RimL family protein N-acetyltransferase